MFRFCFLPGVVASGFLFAFFASNKTQKKLAKMQNAGSESCEYAGFFNRRDSVFLLTNGESHFRN